MSGKSLLRDGKRGLAGMFGTSPAASTTPVYHEEASLPSTSATKAEPPISVTPTQERVNEQQHPASAYGIIANIFSRKFTGQQSSILLMIYELSLARGRTIAVVPELQDFELAGAQRNKVGTGALKELEEAGVIIRHRMTNGYEIVTDVEKWQVPLVPKFSQQRYSELLEHNPPDVPKKDIMYQIGTSYTETGHDIPNWYITYQNRTFYRDLVGIPQISHIPEWYTISQGGIWSDIPKQYMIYQLGTSYPDMGHDNVPKWDIMYQSGIRYTKLGHNSAEILLLLSSNSIADKRDLKKESKIYHHDDEVNSLRETYQQYKSLWDAYKKIFGLEPNPIMINKLHSFVEDGMEEVVVIHYMTKAREGNKTLDYAKKCCINAYEKGIRTLEAVIEDEKAFEAAKHQKQSGGVGSQQLNVPSAQADQWKLKFGG